MDGNPLNSDTKTLERTELEKRRISLWDLCPESSRRVVGPVVSRNAESQPADVNSSRAGKGTVHCISLQEGEQLFLQNVVHFRVARGAAEIYGHVFEASDSYHSVALPLWGFSLPVTAIRGRRHSAEKEIPIVPAGTETKPGSVNDLLKTDSGNGNENQFPTVICFRSVKCTFGTCSAASAVTVSPSARPLRIHPKWPKIASMFLEQTLKQAKKTSPSVILVSGASSNGKTTFCCYLLNRLLSSLEHVYYLETDLGQPLFTTPGMISLHKVTRPILSTPHGLVNSCSPLMSCCVTAVSPESDPQQYIRSVAQCSLSYFQFSGGYPLSVASSTANNTSVSDSEQRDTELIKNVTDGQEQQASDSTKSRKSVKCKTVVPPLVVNTHGWVKGLGWQCVEAIGALTWAKMHVEITTDVNTDEAWLINGVEYEGDRPDCDTAVMNLPQRSEFVERGKAAPRGKWSRNRQRKRFRTFNQPCVNSPFDNIVEEGCGFRPLPWSKNLTELITIQIAPVVAKTDTTPLPKPTNAQLRWLRFAAFFDPSYSWALHFPRSSEEEFFGGSLRSPFIENYHLRLLPKQVTININRLQLCGLNVSDWQTNIPEVLTRSLVALCHDDSFSANQVESSKGLYASSKNLLSIRICRSRPSCRCLGVAWVHSVDPLKKQIIFYTSCDVAKAEIIAEVNTLQIGNQTKYGWNPDDVKKMVYRFPSHENADEKYDRGLFQSESFGCCSATTPYLEDREIQESTCALGAFELGSSIGQTMAKIKKKM